MKFDRTVDSSKKSFFHKKCTYPTLPCSYRNYVEIPNVEFSDGSMIVLYLCRSEEYEGSVIFKSV